MKKMILVLTASVLILPAVFAGSMVTLKDLKLPDSFPQEWSFYQITSIQKDDEHPGFLKFHVKATHADYDVEGLLALKKLLQEIKVIELIKRDQLGSGIVDGAVDSVKATGEGFVNLVAHPIESAKGVGRAAGELGRSIGGVFRKKQAGEQSSFDEKLVGSSERELAGQFGVDVYTANPHMKDLLHQMAVARMGGKGAAVIVKLLLPVAGIVSVTLTASGINEAADQLINDKSRADVYRLNKIALENLAFSSDEVSGLLNQPFYSPREVTYLRFYLERLKDVPGYRDLMSAAREAASPLESRKILYEAQLAALAKSKAGGDAAFERIQILDDGLALFQKNRLLFMTAYDYLESSPFADSLVREVRDLRNKTGKGAVEIWNLGRVTNECSSVSFLRGVKVRGHVLLDPDFGK